MRQFDSPRRGLENLVWDYEHENEAERKKGEPSALKILKEINGFFSEDPRAIASVSASSRTTARRPARRGSTPGVYPMVREASGRQAPDPPGKPGAQVQWGWAWPANRRVMYNRASADPEGKPWSERRSGFGGMRRQKNGSATMYRTTSQRNRLPTSETRSGRHGCASGTAPFIMRPDGLGWLFVPAGLVDGPLPTHYEPVESPVAGCFTNSKTSPVYQILEGAATIWPRWEIQSSPMS